MLDELHKTFEEESKGSLGNLKSAATQNKNIFEALMEATKYCSIGQITNALFEVGGQYRRNM
jgi:methylmalonyl-CoA mutase